MFTTRCVRSAAPSLLMGRARMFGSMSLANKSDDQDQHYKRVSWLVFSAFTGGMMLQKVASCDDIPGLEDMVLAPLQKEAGAVQYPANPNLEDRTINSTVYFSGNPLRLFCVFDGHGGFEVAEHARSLVVPTLQAELSQLKSPLPDRPLLSLVSETNIENAMKRTFLSIDKARLNSVKNNNDIENKPARIGACGLTVLLSPDMIVTANAGDCKAVLSRNGRALPLCRQHSANDEDERARLAAAHPNEKDIVVCKRCYTIPDEGSSAAEKLLIKLGVIKPKEKQVMSACYVKGRLQPTRAFGDFHLKLAEANAQGRQVRPPYSFPYITAEPEVTFFGRDANQDQFIVLGSDGLWDFFEDQECIDVASKAFREVDLKSGIPAVQQVANVLLETVLERAAMQSKMTVAELKDLPRGIRRRFHDDTTIVVAMLKNDKDNIYDGATHFNVASAKL